MARRFILPVLAALAVVACSGADSGSSNASNASSAPAPVVTGKLDRGDIERDLTLTLRRTTKDAFELDRAPGFEIVVSNRSRDRSYPIVLSSDGSESGWREPHVFYTVERRTGEGPWKEAPTHPLLRCGNYDVDWTKDVVVLDPGKEVVLPWTQFYHGQWDLDAASHVRVVAHYVYGDHARDLRKVPPVLHPVPPYALTSNAMELAVDPPITLEITWNGSLPRPGQPLSASVDVTATNRGQTELPFATADTGANLRLEVEGLEGDGSTSRHTVMTSLSVNNASERLRAGERKSVVGASTAIDFDSELPADFRPRRVRALLHLWWYTDQAAGKSDERIPRSPWVEAKAR